MHICMGMQIYEAIQATAVTQVVITSTTWCFSRNGTNDTNTTIPHNCYLLGPPTCKFNIIFQLKYYNTRFCGN